MKTDVLMGEAQFDGHVLRFVNVLSDTFGMSLLKSILMAGHDGKLFISRREIYWIYLFSYK